MLSGLFICASLTAMVVGVTGAWSPCGFSMVQTIGSALGSPGPNRIRAACAAFTFGCVIGGVITFGALATIGHLLAGVSAGLGVWLGVGLATMVAVADWRGVRIAPQIRRQVPQSWRWRMPLMLASGLYGVLLGLGFTTFVLAFAVWGLAGISMAAADPLLGCVIGGAFGLGRALPVLWLAPTLERGPGQRRLDGLAAEPALWLGLRRVDALGVALCALLLGATGAHAAVLQAATDPSAAGRQLAWQRLGGHGELRLADGHLMALPGDLPALSGTSVAWYAEDAITIADRATLTVHQRVQAGRVNALALSDRWVVYRIAERHGQESLRARSLSGDDTLRYLAGPAPAGEIGRPAIDGSEVVYSVDARTRNKIVEVDLISGRRHWLRAYAARYGLANPSLMHGRLLYERTDRCFQQLRIGRLFSRRGERVLLERASIARRDPGYQRGYEPAHNSASLCRGHRAGGGGSQILGPTALNRRRAYVAVMGSDGRSAKIVAIVR